MEGLDAAIANTRAHLLSLRNVQGYWEGELSSSALSTATAIVALTLVDAAAHDVLITRGAQWLINHQNSDGGWGDTTISKSNLSTTLLCWCALTLISTQRANLCPDEAANYSAALPSLAATFARCENWIRERVGSLEPDAICKAVVARYGKDKTFSVPILMTCAIGRRLGPHDEAWRRVLALPFELAAFPRSWFGAIGLPVVSYALPALIAIGHARFHHAPPRRWNPLRWIRAALWPRISPMLKTLQPSTGGYLEATPLTSFVTMALASAGQKSHSCVPDAVRFLQASQREDGSWAIDTNLATWVTTLSVKALHGSAGTHARNQSDLGGTAANMNEADRNVRAPLKDWLHNQQYKTIHPFTNAAPGGWAWTDLPGGVPDADDTSGALIALWHLGESDNERSAMVPAVEAGVTWLLNLQNSDGGIPTFCRGWGTLPFDRSTPEITAHAFWAFSLWSDHLGSVTMRRLDAAVRRAMRYLRGCQRQDGSWQPLWFGNENARDEENPVHGSAMVLLSLAQGSQHDNDTGKMMQAAVEFLLHCQHHDGGWGGAAGVAATIEETANAVNALSSIIDLKALPDPDLSKIREAVARGVTWLIEHTQNGTRFPAAPIGLYFARLWYHEKIYPVVWTLAALQNAEVVLKRA